MDLRLLGPVEVRLDDGPIELGPRQQRAVLAMLALEVGRTVSADRLAEGLWGDATPSTAAKMIQLYVSRLRRVLAGNGASILTRGRGYELQVPEEDVDVVRFERLLETRPRAALALWRGAALSDLADEPFAAAEIRRLEELRLRAAELAIDADLAAGHHAAVIGELDALVAQEPLRERLHAQRMLALYRSGRQADALEAYRAARAALVEQVGVEPGAELRRLQDAILAQDPALDLPAAAEPAQETPPQRARSSRRLLVAAAGLLLAGLLAFGVIRVLEPDSLPGIDEDTVGLIDPDGGRITFQYPVGHSPGAITAGGGSVWVANRLDGTVSRIDRERRQVFTIPTGGAPAALAFGAGSLWVADGDSRHVVQVDPGSNKVLQWIEAANAPRSLALTEGALWVVSGAEGDVHRVDLDDAHTARAIPLGAKATAIAAGAGALWVASEEAGTVTRLDQRTGRVVEAIPVGHAPSALAVGEGAVWVVNRTDGTLSRIDPDANSVSWSVGVGHDPTAVAVGEGAVWVAGGEEGTVARIDPEGPRVLERRRTGSSPSALVVAGGSVWTAAVAPDAAHRGGTLRADLPTSSPVPVNWLHPDAYAWNTWMVASLAYDGLVAYRRVAGVAGATLVGALATRPPRPSVDGRTYVFTLRRGIRYSDGTPVSPGDFRASMERYLGASRGTFPPFFAGIAGAESCMTGRARCDLSRSIESDPHARTITVHLTARDPEFLHKLTLPFAYLVPPGTPARRGAADLAPPGTGPYRIAGWDARRGGVLVRNPHFRPTAARPAGFTDRIEVKLSRLGRLETHTAAVERGSADVAWLGDLPLRGHLPGLLARAPGRLHSSPMAGTLWMFLNVRRPPFDDIRVRRAINLATDRAALVKLYGGPAAAAAACQIVPTAFPGFSPYCPHTAGASRGGGWTAPDVERARGLIAASGRAGARVAVDVSEEERRRAGPYFVSLLSELGLRARLRVISDVNDYFTYIKRRGTGAQMGGFAWGADYLSASTLLDPTFACAARGDPTVENVSRVCDRRLDAAISRARAAAPADAPAAWAAADRRVVDLAAAVPYANPRATVFVSKRAGNVMYHATYATLLDQMWVR